MQENKCGKIRIWLVEDNEDDAVIIRNALAEIDTQEYLLDWFTTLSKTESSLTQQTPEVLLLDLSLPDAQDFTGLARLQGLIPSVPLIILTGLNSPEKAQAALQRGAEDYLVKGQINSNLLHRTISYSIERKKVKAQLAAANEALREMVGQDSLTGLLNRRGFQDVLVKLTAIRKRTGLDLQALLIDLDNFKFLNEKYGYGIGDMALREVTKVIKEMVRTSDYVARVGGDEIIVLLVNARMEEAFRIAEKLRVLIAQNVLMTDAGGPVRVTCSFGVASIDEGCEILEGLFNRLENSLRRSKEMGKNRITVQEDGGQMRAMAVEAGGATAKPEFTPDNFYAVCQPIYRLKDKVEVAYEMLVRLRHETVKNVVDLFLNARQHNLLTWVDFQCFKTCLQACRSFSEGAQIHINILPSTVLTLGAERIIEEIAQLDGKYSLCLELSEQQIVGDASHLFPETARLKSHGIKIAIDDVGFGYSSLESLVILEPNIVKVDICCISGIDQDKVKQLQFNRLVKVIQACDAEYVIEGIELAAEYDFLCASGVQLGQGYYLCRPRPV